MTTEPLFSVGQSVRLRVQPSRSGIVIGILSSVAGQPRYRVYHAADDQREYYEDQLTAEDLPDPTSAIANALQQRRWLEPDVFRAGMTASRLSHPAMDSLYSLQAARIQFIPFQFKPLLRFLRSDRPRLLIADEVGVGKTIEAGLILRELQTRQRLNRILIVCPKALVTKWRAEMRRFDEDFRPLSSESLAYCLRETDLDGVWPAEYSRAIVHLELLRNPKYLLGDSKYTTNTGLLELDLSQIFDLLIVDEAHHLRNPQTRSHALARFLCDTSEAVLFLSATPVHTGSENLFTLLNLLRDDLFPDFAVFRNSIEPTSALVDAMRSIRSRLPEATWQADAKVALDEALETDWGRRVLTRDPRLQNWRARLAHADEMSDYERVRCLRDLEEAHPLAHVMNRTRRRDIGAFTLREPHTIEVPFTRFQTKFYTALVAFRYDVLRQLYDPLVARLIIDVLERQASSCLPALVPVLDRFIRTGRFSRAEVTDDEEGDMQELVELTPRLKEQANNLKRMAHELPEEDPKLDRLREIVDSTLQSDGPRKVLVFSFFLNTLAYLSEQLTKGDCRVEVVSGRVDDESREHMRARFRLPFDHPDAIDVLLSSEVGCEGLDYEFCDRLVNYDIPWNPMRIEQRIGRIDRFGQESDKILIFNFITPGTVEERIFYRCFERLGIFRRTVGDLEAVLGELVAALNESALDPKLTPVQAEQKARRAIDHTLAELEEKRRLEEEAGALLGIEQAFIEDVQQLVQEGRYVSSHDLKEMIRVFLQESGIGGQIVDDSHVQGLSRLRINRDGRTQIRQQVADWSRSNLSARDFIRWLDSGNASLEVTFDQATALERRDLSFITPIHPLARLATAYCTGDSRPLIANLELLDVDLQPGRFLFVFDLWESSALQPEIRLKAFAWDLDRHLVVPDLGEMLIGRLSAMTRSERSLQVDAWEVQRGLSQLDEISHAARTEALTQLSEHNRHLSNRRLASLESTHQYRQRRIREDLERTSEERIQRMRRSEGARIEAEYQRRREEILAREQVDIFVTRIAAGILSIIGSEQ